MCQLTIGYDLYPLVHLTVFTKYQIVDCKDYLVGMSIRSGFPGFGQNREPEPGYPGSLFWATGTGTGTPVKPESWLPASFGCTWSSNQFFKKKKIGLF
jgi:hypothetical protein